MTDQSIFYILALLGWFGLIVGKITDRDDTIWKWLKENAMFVLSFAIAIAGTALIGPGDGVDVGSYAARTLAFTVPVTVGEAMWRAFTAKQSLKARNIRKAPQK